MKTLNKLWRAWKRFGQFMGTILAYIVLTIFYFTFFLPYAVGMTWLSDPLHIRQPKPVWAVREANDPSIEADEPSIEGARRQF